MSFELSREQYTSLYGPTTGDAIRLADTELFAVVEEDLTTPGEEAVFGGGKVIRDGMGQNSQLVRDVGVPDLVITNVVVIDWTGIYKADIAVRDAHIVAIGKAGNPHTMDGVDIVIGVATDVISGEGKILTAGGIDTHVHFISPDQIEAALSSGLTTMIGGGTGPSESSKATTITPGEWNIHTMLRSFEHWPMNFGLLGKGHGSSISPMAEQIRAGAIGLKVHEDWGATPSSINTALQVADEYDVQVAIHTDTLNESGFVEDTRAAIDGRVIHTFHTEGAGGGHAPDIIELAQYPNILPASTNPTLPYTTNTVEEHVDMLMVAHHLNADLPEDVAFADSRIRKETIAAEDVLQDMGIFSMTSSDSQAMGRVGEVLIRTWQVADSMKRQRGPLPEDEGTAGDNHRIKRYVSKYTINPAIAHGIADSVGSVEVGKFADFVLVDPRRPEQIAANVEAARHLIKAGVPAPYRIHEKPPEGKYADLLEFLKEFKLSLPPWGKVQPGDYTRLLKKVRERPDAALLESVLLRSQSLAVYSPDNAGHFGLALDLRFFRSLSLLKLGLERGIGLSKRRFPVGLFLRQLLVSLGRCQPLSQTVEGLAQGQPGRLSGLLRNQPAQPVVLRGPVKDQLDRHPIGDDRGHGHGGLALAGQQLAGGLIGKDRVRIADQHHRPIRQARDDFVAQQGQGLAVRWGVENQQVDTGPSRQAIGHVLARTEPREIRVMGVMGRPQSGQHGDLAGQLTWIGLQGLGGGQCAVRCSS